MKYFLLLFFSLCLSGLNLLQAATVSRTDSEVEQAEYGQRVKKAFVKAWDAYKNYAWGCDAVNPISKKGHNWYQQSLLMTPVDAFSTMCVMGLDKQKKEAKKLIFSKLRFDCDMDVQQFEIGIRMLGGLLSAYQLDHDRRFLGLAEDLGRRLIPVFDSPTGIPYRMVNLKTGRVSGKITNPCEVGSTLLEYGMLSRITHNPIYYEKCKRGVMAVFRRRSSTTGLVGSLIDVETGRWTNADSHISGGIDAYYEYLVKGWLLFGDNDLKMMWNSYKTNIRRYLADNTTSGFWYGHADMNTGRRTATTFGALDCFFGAVLCLDGDLPTAKKLQQSIWKMWSLYGLEPESMDYSTMKVLAPYYMARPEAIEATYYLWHYTHDKQYYAMGRKMFESIEKYCQLPNGYTQIKDVRTMQKWDDLESFFFAETMMYCYLFFAPKQAFDFDKCILNTEAHPFFPVGSK